MFDHATTSARRSLWRTLLKLAIIPLLLLAGVGASFLPIFHHAQSAHAAGSLPTPWWHHVAAERELNAVRYGYTLQDVQNNLSTYVADGYQVINLDWPIQAGPVCIYGGFSASDYYHVDPRLAASGTNADTDWTNFVTAVHNQGMAIDSWFNPSYIWTGSPLFKQAEADVKTYGTNRANQPANSPARYFEWRSQTGNVTKPTDNFCGSNINQGSYNSNRWVTDPDAGSNVSYFGEWSDQPSGDYASSEWQTYITGALKHWMDTGIDGFVFDAPGGYYVNCDSSCVKSVLVGTVHSYKSNVAAFGEEPSGGGTISSYGFDGVENTTFWSGKPWTDAINNQNPSSIDTSSTLSDRDGDVSAGGTSYEQFAPAVLNDNSKNLLAAATLLSTGNYLAVQSTTATSDSDGSNFGEFGAWPTDSGTQASFSAITTAIRNSAALDNSGTRAKLSTNNDNAYYAFARTSPDGNSKAVVVLNFTGSQQNITVNGLANQGIADGATADLINGGSGPGISNGSLSTTLPAWGYAFYGVPSASCSSNLCGTEGNPPANTNLTSEGTSDWAHWGANNNPGQFDHKSSGGSQISNYTKVGGGMVSAYTNNPNSFSWLDGTPTGSSSNNTAGIWNYGTNNGFSITAPADTTTRTLRVYVGVWKAQGKLTASLSDGSASNYVDSSLNNGGGTTNGVYTFHYRANSANQHLTVSFVVQSASDPYGNVTLQAASLQLGGSTVTVDDNASGWTYNGWYEYADANAYDGTAHGNNANGNYGSYTFNGTSVDVYAWKGPDGGTVQVCVDSSCGGTISLGNTGGDIYNQKIYSVSGLTRSSHTVKITANSTNTNLWEMVDYIVYTT